MKQFQVVNDGQVKATVAIVPDCRLGDTGQCESRKASPAISELRTFFVGALPSVDEKEPNSDFAERRRRST